MDKYSIDEHSSSDYSEDEDDNFSEQEEETQINVTDNIRLKMLDYCEQTSIPLCDYLDLESFVNFISSLCNTNN